LVLEPTAGDGTRVRLTQTIAPDTPVPRFLQGLLRSFVQGEAVAATRGFLDNVRRALEAACVMVSKRRCFVYPARSPASSNFLKSAFTDA
jgi:hypothetical protein